MPGCKTPFRAASVICAAASLFSALPSDAQHKTPEF
jgi:hypothetical protein